MKIDRDEASKCIHENVYPDYMVTLGCICGGTEYHCKNCGIYFSVCRCGEMEGISGWPWKRHQAHWNNKLGEKKS